MEGKKYDSDKPKWDLLPYDSLEEIVKVFTMGAEKYGSFNWQLLDDPEGRYFAACMRHLSAWKCGELNDSESGLSHLAHAATNLLILNWFKLNGKENI